MDREDLLVWGRLGAVVLACVLLAVSGRAVSVGGAAGGLGERAGVDRAEMGAGIGERPEIDGAPLLAGVLPGSRGVTGLELIGTLALGGAEVVAFDARTRRVAVTVDDGLALVGLDEAGRPALVRVVDVAGALGWRAGGHTSLSHVSIDPKGRGVAAVAVVPARRGVMAGRIAFVMIEGGEVIGSVEVGFNPDAVAFAPDGSRVVVANEGEPEVDHRGGIIDPPGSVSVIDLNGVRNALQFSGVGAEDVRSVYFQGAAMEAVVRGGGDGAAGVRVHPRNRWSPSLDFEPESVVIDGGRAYVTLQENNAIVVIDLDAGVVLRVESLGVYEQRVDAVNDGRISITDRVFGMPMPDQIARFAAGGKAYLVTANEGDSRGSAAMDALETGIGDTVRVSALLSAGLLAAEYEGIAGLRVCAHSGVTGAAGVLDRPVMLGTRSLSVWDGETLERIGDTGSAFEEWVGAHWPEWFNRSFGETSAVDARSEQRGPEPEGVTIGVIGDAVYAFVSLERPGAVAIVDVTSPREPRVVAMEMGAAVGLEGPEGMAFVPARVSPTNEPLLLVAYEATGHLAVYRVVEE